MKLLLLVIAISTTQLLAADPSPSKDTDPFDLSSNNKKIGELGIPTVEKVQALESRASSLYAAKDWKAAATAYDEYAKAANWLANLVSTGIRPFYNADSDTRTEVFRSGGNKLIKYESASNDYRKKRDRALVTEAECLFKTGETSHAMAVLLGVLDRIDAKDSEYWDKGRTMLYDALGVR